MNTTSRPVDTYCIIGNPVMHSRSPWIHARFAELTGQALAYERLLLPLDSFTAGLHSFIARGGRGCNVTVPFKFEAAAAAESKQPARGKSDKTLEHEQRLDNRLTLRGELGWQLPSEESLALRLGGMKTRLAADLRYQATRQDSLVLSHWHEQYRLQTGAEVGRGRHTALEYAHAFRQEAPTLEWGAFWSTHQFDRRPLSLLGQQGQDFLQRIAPAGLGSSLGPDYFVPDSFRFYGLRLSTNMRFEQDHTRALRPFASLSLTRHSQLGAGYDLRLGLAGSVLGPDHLSLSWGMDKSGADSASSANGLTRNLSLSYRLHF